MDLVKDQGDEELYNKLDAAYPTDNEETEREVNYFFTIDLWFCSNDYSNIIIHSCAIHKI